MDEETRAWKAEVLINQISAEVLLGMPDETPRGVVRMAISTALFEAGRRIGREEALGETSD